MDTVLYEKPVRVELVGVNIFVDGEQRPKSVRTLSQMRTTLMSATAGQGNPDMYYMYRSVYKRDDIRFDVTLIPSMDIGGECAKTHGHYHPGSEEGPAYPEVYQVLKGGATFILQKKNRSGSVDAMIIGAKEGETVLLPPGYGHVSINSGEGDLVLSNLVYDRFESMYEEYDENQGAVFYYLKGGEIAQNTNYIVQRSEHLSAPELNSRYGFECKDLLSEFSESPHRFMFLQKPKLLFKA